MRLAYAIDTLTDVAQHAPSFARHGSEVDKTQWHQLLELAPKHLDDELTREPNPEIELGR